MTQDRVLSVTRELELTRLGSPLGRQCALVRLPHPSNYAARSLQDGHCLVEIMES
ncbi:MAG: hypothetical protein V1793_25640 [Pseudomonadota bacterium]